MTLEQVAQTVWAEILVILSVPLESRPNIGGYLCVRSRTDGRACLTMEIGSSSADSAEHLLCRIARSCRRNSDDSLGRRLLTSFAQGSRRHS